MRNLQPVVAFGAGCILSSVRILATYRVCIPPTMLALDSHSSAFPFWHQLGRKCQTVRKKSARDIFATCAFRQTDRNLVCFGNIGANATSPSSRQVVFPDRSKGKRWSRSRAVLAGAAVAALIISIELVSSDQERKPWKNLGAAPAQRPRVSASARASIRS